MSNLNKLLLKSATIEDLRFFVEELSSPLNFSCGDELMDKLKAYSQSNSPRDKSALCELIEQEIGYAGSSDIAYCWRRMWRKKGGVSFSETIADVANKLKVEVCKNDPLVTQLQDIGDAILLQNCENMTSAQFNDFLTATVDGKLRREEILHQVKTKGMAVLPAILVRIFGKEFVKDLIMAIVLKTVTKYASKEAGKIVARELAKRASASWIGPASWIVTIVWSLLDIQGPGYRNTIPIVLYLAVIALRENSDSSRIRNAA
jgi:uncharacterized protein YaaW (UPF0174 family)